MMRVSFRLTRLMYGALSIVALLPLATHGDASVFTAEESDTSPFCYRFEQQLSAVVHHEYNLVKKAGDTTIVLWPPHSDAQGRDEGETAAKDGDETALLITADEDASITFSDDLSLETSSVDSIMVTLKVQGTNALRLVWRFLPVDWDFCSKEGNCWVRFPVNNDGLEHTYVIRVADMERWLQYRVVAGIQLMADNPADITVSRAEIRMRQGRYAADFAGAVEHRIGNEVRQCLYMHTPSRMAYRLLLPEHPVFTAGLAVLEPDKPVNFQLHVTDGERQTTLLDETVESANQWRPYSIDLSDFSGKEVGIEFETTADAAGQVAFWSNPVVHEPVASGEHGMPNVLFYLVDALRADRLECYGYDKHTAPTIAKLAQSGILFHYYFTHATCTKPSVMTLFSGVDALTHGFRCYEGYAIPEEMTLFPAQLRSVGYNLGAVSENPFAPPFASSQATFCSVVELDETDPAVYKQTYAAASSFLEEHKDRPFFLYVHTMECHSRRETPDPEKYGFLPPPPFDALWTHPETASEQERYDASIVFADQNFRRILDKLEELGLRENTLVIFTSDHGTALGERGDWGHGCSPYSDQIHVPLIFNWPAGIQPTGKIDAFVQTVDLPVTLLEIMGAPVPRHYQGTSLLPLLKGQHTNAFDNRTIISHNGWHINEYSVIKDGWKLILDNKGQEYLFAMPADMAEEQDASRLHPDIVTHLHLLATDYVADALISFTNLHQDKDHAYELQIDPEKLMIMESLGYLGNIR